jgi:predicted transcriptional regulator
VPRATLSRILADFRDRDLVTRADHEYRTTPLGDLLAAELGSLYAAVAAMATLRDLGAWPHVAELDLPVDRLADVDVVAAEPTDPLAPVRRAEALLADGSRVRILAHSMVPGCLEVVWRTVTEGRGTLEWVTTAGAVETLADDPEMTRQARDLLAAEAATGLLHPDESLPLVFVVDDLVFVAVTDESGTIRGHVESTDEAVRAWAEETIDAYAGAAEPVGAEVLTT